MKDLQYVYEEFLCINVYSIPILSVNTRQKFHFYRTINLTTIFCILPKLNQPTLYWIKELLFILLFLTLNGKLINKYPAAGAFQQYISKYQMSWKKFVSSPFWNFKMYYWKETVGVLRRVYSLTSNFTFTFSSTFTSRCFHVLLSLTTGKFSRHGDFHITLNFPSHTINGSAWF